MLPMTTTQSLALFLRALQGQNYSPKTLRAYGDDLHQFLAWVEKNRVDWDITTRFSRADIEGFMQYLAAQRMTGVTRVRKLAAIRKFFTFLEENSILAANPANTVKGARREEKEPNILYKEQYKALLYEASDNIRDYAIIQTFLQTGIRLSELVNLHVDDVDVEHRNLTVRQGKGKKDRQIPLVDGGLKALSNHPPPRQKRHINECLDGQVSGCQVRQEGGDSQKGERPSFAAHLRGAQSG